MIINGQEEWIVLQNPNFLARLISEGMALAMGNYINHMWLANVLDPLAPALDPTLFHNMQAHWNLMQHFNPLNNMELLYQLLFFTPVNQVTDHPIFYPWQPIPQHNSIPLDIYNQQHPPN